MRSNCPSCGTTALTKDGVARRIRCRTCGTVRTVSPSANAAVPKRGSVVMSVSRVSDGTTRTVVLLDDGTTELRVNGSPEVVGSMPRAVVRTWSSMRIPKHFENENGEWKGGRPAERVYSMVSGVWGTVASTPL
jgi:hypothetical protein